MQGLPIRENEDLTFSKGTSWMASDIVCLSKVINGDQVDNKTQASENDTTQGQEENMESPFCSFKKRPEMES